MNWIYTRFLDDFKFMLKDLKEENPQDINEVKTEINKLIEEFLK